MSVPEPVILCDPFYHSSNWFQEIIAGFRDAAAKDRNNSPIHIHSMGTIGQLRLEPGIPVIVTNSSLKNLTSAVQQLRQAGIPVILSGVDGAHFGSDICSVASDSALAMTQMVRYLLSYDRSGRVLVLVQKRYGVSGRGRRRRGPLRVSDFPAEYFPLGKPAG